MGSVLLGRQWKGSGGLLSMKKAALMAALLKIGTRQKMACFEKLDTASGLSEKIGTGQRRIVKNYYRLVFGLFAWTHSSTFVLLKMIMRIILIRPVCA